MTVMSVISAMITSLFGNSEKSQEKGGRTFQIKRAAQILRYYWGQFFTFSPPAAYIVVPIP